MGTTTLSARPRDRTGKGVARSLRREGWVPAVLYGHDVPARPLAVAARDLERLLNAISWENTLVELRVDEEPPASVLIREVQFHPFKSQILHVDFLQVRAGQKVQVEVPVRIVGTAPGVKVGGILETALHTLTVRCDPARIPEAIEVDVSALAIGDSLHVADLKRPDLEILTDPGTTVVVVVPPAVAAAEEAAAAPAAVEEAVEPEVIRRPRKEEAEEAEEVEEGE